MTEPCSTLPQSRSPPLSARKAGPRVDLPVHGLDLPLQRRLFVRRFLPELFMQGEHLLHQEGHAIVASDISRISRLCDMEQTQAAENVICRMRNRDDRS